MVPWDRVTVGGLNGTTFQAGHVTDYAINLILCGSALNTTGPVNAPTYVNYAQPFYEFHRTLGGISDGTSNTIMVGT